MKNCTSKTREEHYKSCRRTAVKKTQARLRAVNDEAAHRCGHGFTGMPGVESGPRGATRHSVIGGFGTRDAFDGTVIELFLMLRELTARFVRLHPEAARS